MLVFFADENFNADIVRALHRLNPSISIFTVQELGLRGATDLTVLEAAAKRAAIVLTHDLSTMPRFAFERVRTHLKMPGLFAVPRSAALRQVIEDLLLLAECSEADE